MMNHNSDYLALFFFWLLFWLTCLFGFGTENFWFFNFTKALWVVGVPCLVQFVYRFFFFLLGIFSCYKNGRLLSLDCWELNLNWIFQKFFNLSKIVSNSNTLPIYYFILMFLYLFDCLFFIIDVKKYGNFFMSLSFLKFNDSLNSCKSVSLPGHVRYENDVWSGVHQNFLSFFFTKPCF